MCPMDRFPRAVPPNHCMSGCRFQCVPHGRALSKLHGNIMLDTKKGCKNEFEFFIRDRVRNLNTSEVATESSGKRGRIAASFSCCHRDEPNLPVPTTPRQHGYGREPTGALRAMRKSNNSRYQRFSSRDCAHRRWVAKALVSIVFPVFFFLRPTRVRQGRASWDTASANS